MRRLPIAVSLKKPIQKLSIVLHYALDRPVRKFAATTPSGTDRFVFRKRNAFHHGLLAPCFAGCHKVLVRSLQEEPIPARNLTGVAIFKQHKPISLFVRLNIKKQDTLIYLTRPNLT